MRVTGNLLLATFLVLGCAGGSSRPPCANGVLDPGETAIDCGGACGLCPGDACTEPLVCSSQNCVGGFCAVATCSDGIMNGAEYGVDCGGGCPACSFPDVRDDTSGDTTGDALGDATQRGPRVDVTPATLDFGSVQFEAMGTIAVRNSGDADLLVTRLFLTGSDAFALDLGTTPWPVGAGSGATGIALDPPVSIAPGDSRDLAVRFSPGFTPVPSAEGVLRLETNDPTQPAGATVPLRGSNFGGPHPMVSPSSFTFFGVTPGTTATQEFHVFGATTTMPFTILSVELAAPSLIFRVVDAPAAGTVVRAPEDPAYADVTFAVTFSPTSADVVDTTLLVRTDAGDVQVPIAFGAAAGTLTHTLSVPAGFDFTGASGTPTRSVTLTNSGSTPIALHRWTVMPTSAEARFAISAWIPGTDGAADVQITSWPRGLASGRSVRLDVTLIAGTSAASGQLVIPYDAPDPEELTFVLVAD